MGLAPLLVIVTVCSRQSDLLVARAAPLLSAATALKIVVTVPARASSRCCTKHGLLSKLQHRALRSPSCETWYRHPFTARRTAMPAPLHTSPSPTAAEVTPRSGAVLSRVWFQERPSCFPPKDAGAADGNAGLSHP